MKVAVTGSNGLIGGALVTALKERGDQVVRVVRKRAEEPDTSYWNPEENEIDTEKLEGLDAVVHLAGENVAERWTEERKRRIKSSRINGTTLLSTALARLESPPETFVSASAIGYYGDRGDELLTEESPAGHGFLPSLCTEWEAAVRPARERGIRTVLLRIGVVLSVRGGALAKMLPPFQFGAGGILGNGQQYMSWITLDDLVRVILFALENEQLHGPVNAVSPEPVRNSEFTRALGRVLHRPTIFPVPRMVLHLAVGEMAEELVLASARIIPQELNRKNFQFEHADATEALQHVIENRI